MGRKKERKGEETINHRLQYELKTLVLCGVHYMKTFPIFYKSISFVNDNRKVGQRFYEVTIQTLPRLKHIMFVTMRSSHLPFKMHQIDFRAFAFNLY